MRGTIRFGLTVLAIAVSVACALNVYGDDAQVRSDAEAVACPRGCAQASASQMRVDRSPVAETIAYELPGGTVTVRCTRAAVLVGPYGCVKE